MPPPKPEHTREALIAAAQAVAAKQGGDRLTVGAFCKATGINPSRVYARFDDWPTLCAEAGLAPGDKPAEISSDRLLADLHAAVMEAGGFEKSAALMRRVPAGAITYTRRFGDWTGILTALKDWVAEHAPDFPYCRELDVRLANQKRRKPRGGPAPRDTPTRPPWPSTGARTSGPPLAFRAMASAPVNEQGVVLLFGMVAEELGYAVDAIGTAYPDCAARRLVANGPGGGSGADARWEPVRVEFEYRSRSFLYHAHDPEGCDVIVCWQHD